jgi:hypothetical protein
MAESIGTSRRAHINMRTDQHKQKSSADYETTEFKNASESAKVHALSQRSRPSYHAYLHLLPSIQSARSGFRQPKSISFPTASHWRQTRVLLDSHLNFHLACDC